MPSWCGVRSQFPSSILTICTAGYLCSLIPHSLSDNTLAFSASFCLLASEERAGCSIARLGPGDHGIPHPPRSVATGGNIVGNMELYRACSGDLRTVGCLGPTSPTPPTPHSARRGARACRGTPEYAEKWDMFGQMLPVTARGCQGPTAACRLDDPAIHRYGAYIPYRQ
jgi:hypothetical protein